MGVKNDNRDKAIAFALFNLYQTEKDDEYLLYSLADVIEAANGYLTGVEPLDRPQAIEMAGAIMAATAEIYYKYLVDEDGGDNEEG